MRSWNIDGATLLLRPGTGLAGLLTRIDAFLLACTMAVAVFRLLGKKKAATEVAAAMNPI